MSFTPLDERFSRRGNATKGLMDQNTNPANQTPAYDDVYDDQSKNPLPWWNPKGWTKRCWLISAIVFVIIAVVVIAVSVVEVKENAYPNYSKLDYHLVDTYSGTSFFDNFDFFSETDPSNGFVIYVDQSGAEWLNLTYATSESAILKVDTSTNVDTSSGRRSVRITSKTQYDSGLFVFDVAHTPYGCATWPALWLSDPDNWPTNGEIDVLEAVNTATDGNQVALHTTKGCKVDVKRKQTGTSTHTNCYNGTNNNAGCGVKGSDESFGEDFNDDDGGVYALEYRDSGIRVWWWPRSSIPSDIETSTSNTTNSTTVPDPSGWGKAMADFPNTHCDISKHFKNQSIIANINLCGDWASDTYYYTTIADCPGSCENYVQNNGSEFSEAYWEFRSFRVYQST